MDKKIPYRAASSFIAIAYSSVGGLINHESVPGHFGRLALLHVAPRR